MNEDVAAAIMTLGLVIGAGFVGLLVLLVVKSGNMQPPMLLPVAAMFPLTWVAAYNLIGATMVWAGLQSIAVVLGLSMLAALAVASWMDRVWRRINNDRLHRSPPYDGLP